MHGNVWEWVHDGWQPDAYQNLTGKSATNPRCDTPDDNRRVVRGDDYFMSAEECRSACRDCYAADTRWNDGGVRVVLSNEAVRKLNKTKKSNQASKLTQTARQLRFSIRDHPEVVAGVPHALVEDLATMSHQQGRWK